MDKKGVMIVGALVLACTLSISSAIAISGAQPESHGQFPKALDRGGLIQAKAGMKTKNTAETDLPCPTDDLLALRRERIVDPNNYTFTTSKGFHGAVVDGVTYIEGYLIANKTYALPQDYGDGLTSDTLSAFYAMQAGARADGLSIYISSGFRSYNTQAGLYSRYVKRDGVEKADTYSARAGHSEHQSGLAFDVNIIDDSFIGTPEAIWLSDHCYEYGFILRYPQGKTDETGYKYEPWHFRYVGTELAGILYDGGNWITMEDYFGITSQYQEQE